MLVSRTDNLTGIDEFLHAVGTPSGDTCDGEQWGIELLRQIKHTVNKSAIKVHIGTYTLVNVAFFRDDLRSQALYIRIEGKFAM